MATERPPCTITPLSSCTPPSTGRAWQTAPHPHQPFVATACADKTVRIYSLTSFTLLSTITGGHKRSVRCCSWKPNLPSTKPNTDSTLATGSFDASAAIWVGRPGQEVIDTGLTEGGWDRSAEERDEDDEDFRFAVVLEGHDSEIKSISWSAHGTFLATCSRDKTVWLWEALSEDSGAIGRGGMLAGGGGGVDDEDNYETVAVLQEHDGDVKTVSWHPTEEQCLASGSYDEMIRVWREDIDGEWGCVGVCEGHTGTVWDIDWEPWGTNTQEDGQGETEVKAEEEETTDRGPRILSCSDDMTIRLWRRKPKPRSSHPTGPRMPSIIRSSSDEEDWFEEGRIPEAHDRAILSIAWSKRSRRVVSAGSDGKLVVYEEIKPDTSDVVMTNGEEQANGTAKGDGTDHTKSKSSWNILAEIESAHGVFEINHVCWARRFDRGRRHSDEEIIISTGDDGEVKIWTLEGV